MDEPTSASRGPGGRTTSGRPPAFYARAGRLGEWWTLLHPPYTLWHLSYVAIGAALAPGMELRDLGWVLAAFALALGLGAHALDELNGRPLGTSIPARTLVIAGAAGLGGGVLFGVYGVTLVGLGLVPFIVAGTFLALAYNLEWFGGWFHTDAWFAATWGSFPVVVGNFAQEGSVSIAALVAAGWAFGLSYAQRSLSTQARLIRRRTRETSVRLRLRSGETMMGDESFVLDPLEKALVSLSWATVLLAAALLARALL
jgi:hypothetical protein